MAFMQPEITDEDFLIVECRYTTSLFPAEIANLSKLQLSPRKRYYGVQGKQSLAEFVGAGDRDNVISYSLVSGLFWARLSAPGYTDSTEWLGPFITEQEARDELSAMFDVCSSCGSDLFESEDSECLACKGAD